MRLESILSKFVSLGPKVYGGKTIDGLEFTKVKGLKNPPSVVELESKLNINSSDLEINQEKWFRSPQEGHILIKDSPYNINITSTKRIPVFNDEGKLIDTQNIILNENKK